MKKILFILFAITFTNVNLLASNNETAIIAGIIGFGILIWASIAVVMLFFILTQNKLIDILKLKNIENTMSKVWTWTQLIPLWVYVAQVLAIIKISEQYESYINENNIKIYKITEYKPLWGWLFLVFGVVSIFMPLLGIVALVFWILYWVNITAVTKSIRYYNLNKQEENK